MDHARTTSEHPEAKPVGNKATARTLTLLKSLADRSDSVGVTEISRELGMTKNMAHRALTTLLAHDLVVRDQSGTRYDLGYGILDLHGPDVSDPDIRTTCRPVLERLHALTGESVFLSIIVGRNRVNIDEIAAQGPRVSHAHRGRALPLHITLTGRVLLAFLGDEEIEEYIRRAAPFDQYAEGKIRSAAALWDSIHDIRRRGFGVDYGEQLAGVASAVYAAFPLLDGAGRPHAVATVGGPVERFPLGRAEALVPEMRAIVASVTTGMRLTPASPAFLLGD